MNWNLHGLHIQTEADEEFLRSVLAEGLGNLIEGPPAQGPDSVLRLTTARSAPENGLGLAWRVARQFQLTKGRISLPIKTLRPEDGADWLRVEMGTQARVDVDYARSRVEVSVLDLPFFRSCYDPLYTSSVLHKSFLLELLPRWGIVPLHAGMCALGNRGVVISGRPGAGKSLLLLHLVRQKFAYMADELGFVRRSGDGQELLAFPIRGKLRTHSREGGDLISEAATVAASGGQTVFEPRLLGVRVQSMARAAVVLNVVGHTEGESALRPADPFDAVQSLLLYDVYYSDRHDGAQLEACAELSQQAACFDVSIGGDVARMPRLLMEAMEHG